MTTSEVLALPPGPAMDAAVHRLVFRDVVSLTDIMPPAYSTDDAAGMAILDQLPLFVGRLPASHPGFNAARPWVAGTLSFAPSLQTDAATLRVVSVTRLGALCKAALVSVLQSAAGSPETAIPAPLEAMPPDPPLPASRPKKRGRPAKAVATPALQPVNPVVAPAPARPAVHQPRIFTNAKFPPLPKRKPFVGQIPMPGRK